MATTKNCPGIKQFQQLVAGGVTDMERESLLAHLEQCDACAENLTRLPEPDTLVGVLRQADTLSETTSTSAMADLIDRLSRLRPGAVPASAANLDATIDQPGEPNKSHAYNFLAPAQSADEIGRLGPYRVLDVLGAGGMGVVFRAEDPQLNRHVALKAMLPSIVASETARERFLREARAAAAIKHDHIVAIYQVGEDRGALYLAMELLEGETLETRLKRERMLSLADVLTIGKQIASALAAAHQRGLIHRDIKPANIWLEAETDRVKILDFGLARGRSEPAQLTHEGAIVGTPAYMSPEQGKGADVDHRGDLFSLGCVLYRMATGVAAFPGNDIVSTLLAVATATPQAPRRLNGGVPKALSDLIMSLLAKDPAQRPASAQTVVRMLDEIATAREPAASVAPPRRVTRLVAGTLAATVVLALGVLVAVAVIRLRTPEGLLVVEVNEPGAEILVDGQNVNVVWEKGRKKASIHVKPGTKEVEVRVDKTGFRSNGGKVAFDDAGRAIFHATLTPDAPIAALPKDKNPPATATDDPDHRAARFILAFPRDHGIIVQVNDLDRWIGRVEDLPEEPYRLTALWVEWASKLDDAGLEQFKGCTHLKILRLWGTQATATGLAHFRGCRELEEISFTSDLINDAALEPFRECTKVSRLYLQSRNVTDKGLAQFQGRKEMTALSLAHTQISDDGLAYFKNSKKLKHLVLSETPVTDAGMANFAGCTELEGIECFGTKLGDKSLLHFRNCEKIKKVNFHNMPNLTDVGVAYLKNSSNLQSLNLGGTQVSDHGLAQVKNWKDLSYLNLENTQISDMGLAALKDCKSLGELHLRGTRISEEGLKNLKGYPNLTLLNVVETRLDDKCVPVLADFFRLRQLWIGRTRLTAAGLMQLRTALPQCDIQSELKVK